MDLFPFLLASADVAAQAAGAPVTVNLARENIQSCSLGYIILYFTSFLSLLYNMICILIRGSEPPWSVDYRRLYVHHVTNGEMTPHHQVPSGSDLTKYPLCH